MLLIGLLLHQNQYGQIKNRAIADINVFTSDSTYTFKGLPRHSAILFFTDIDHPHASITLAETRIMINDIEKYEIDYRDHTINDITFNF